MYYGKPQIAEIFLETGTGPKGNHVVLISETEVSTHRPSLLPSAEETTF